MKNATKHADDLRLLFKRLLKQYQPEPKQPQDALKALVRGTMSFDVPDAKAEEAVRLINKEFVNLNELRVATDLEIQELLGTQLSGDRAASGDDHPITQQHLRSASIR